ncbi:hypothetical protein [Aquisphaera insulae]|uniref:hypothetical protein n=1 Tax=Aquisphaera insulae TaxID=2712864 RepID=UPI0013ECEAD6|nr:hypothetical protein [Aquisphaera insulae]
MGNLTSRSTGFGTLAAVLTLLAVAGCRRDWEARTYPASGKVTVNGQPAAGALVQLTPIGPQTPDVRGSKPWGVVQPDGSFVLATYEQAGPGAPAGEYAMTITWPPDVTRPSNEDRLGGKYAKAEQSALKFTIKEGTNVLDEVKIDAPGLDAAPRPAVMKKKGAAPTVNPNDPSVFRKGARKGP